MALTTAIDTILSKIACYDALPLGQVAMLGGRMASLRQIQQAVSDLRKRALPSAGSQFVDSNLKSAEECIKEAVTMLEHLCNMYSNNGQDPEFHWKLFSGLIGGWSAPFEQVKAPRIAPQVWTNGLSPIRVMEYLTPDRVFGRNWNYYIPKWMQEVQDKLTKEPFQMWFETKGSSPEGAKYFDEGMRKAALVTLKGGQLHQLVPCDNGGSILAPLTTANFESGTPAEGMYMAYCLDEYGVMYVYPHPEATEYRSGYFDALCRMGQVSKQPLQKMSKPLFHSSGHGGQPVAGAGMICVTNGSVVGITTKSGHYWPTVEMFLQTLEFLKPALSSASAFFMFMWGEEYCIASCPAADFLRIGKAGFPPGEVSGTFQFGAMQFNTGAFDGAPFDGDKLSQCAKHFLATFSRYSADQTRRILEERRLANRTRLGIYRGRTLDSVLFCEWEVRTLNEVNKEAKADFGARTPFDDSLLDKKVADRHQALMDAAEKGAAPGRARSNNFKRYL
jgi:hypothetical protein